VHSAEGNIEESRRYYNPKPELPAFDHDRILSCGENFNPDIIKIEYSLTTGTHILSGWVRKNEEEKCQNE
jgi:hypothetical protein